MLSECGAEQMRKDGFFWSGDRREGGLVDSHRAFDIWWVPLGWVRVRGKRLSLRLAP